MGEAEFDYIEELNSHSDTDSSILGSTRGCVSNVYDGPDKLGGAIRAGTEERHLGEANRTDGQHCLAAGEETRY